MPKKYKVPRITDLIQGGINAFDDLASTIANPPPDRPVQQAIGNAGRLYCNFIGALPGNASGLLGLGLPLQALLCKPYWDEAGYDAPEENPPFTGGQCQGTNYNVPVEIFNTVTQQWGVQTNLGNCFGPISAITVVSTGQFTSRLTVFCRTSGGAPNERIYNASVSSDRLRAGAITVSGGGNPNLCGDPPGVLEPGTNPPPTPTFPPGQEPGTEPDGQPFFFVPPIPNPIGGDPIEAPPQTPPDEPEEPEEPEPTEPPKEGPTEEGENGDNMFGDPPEGERWVGCCVELTAIPAGAGTVPNTNPETVLTETVGNARLIFDATQGRSYDTPIQIRAKTFCLWEPVKGFNPTGVRVNLKPNFEFTYTPYSVPEDE